MRLFASDTPLGYEDSSTQQAKRTP